VESLLTQVRAFAVKSVAIGGDSKVNVVEDGVVVGPRRDGPAFCLGGPGPTPTDAMRVLGMTTIGDADRAEKTMQQVGGRLGTGPRDAAQMVVDAVVEKIVSEVNRMFSEWEQEPAYRIWEIVLKKSCRLKTWWSGWRRTISGAAGIEASGRQGHRSGVRARGQRARCRRGATHADSEPPHRHGAGRVQRGRGGLIGKLGDRKVDLEEAERMAGKLLAERAERLGIGEYAKEAEVTYSEVFNMVRGWSTVGRLLDVRMEIPAGVLAGWRC